MSHRLLTELEIRMGRWWETYREDGARLRFYQRELANARRLAARPHASIQLLLRQCASARKMETLSASAIETCKRNIRELGIATQ